MVLVLLLLLLLHCPYLIAGTGVHQSLVAFISEIWIQEEKKEKPLSFVRKLHWFNINVARKDVLLCMRSAYKEVFGYLL